MRDVELTRLIEAALGPFPEGLGGEEIGGVDLVMLDADIMGVASHYERNSRPVTDEHAAALVEYLKALDRIFPDLPTDEARRSFAETRAVARHVLEVRAARVALHIGDPWDLGEELAWRPLGGSIVRIDDGDDGGRMLIKLTEPLMYAGKSWRWAIASPRYEGEVIRDLYTRSQLTVAVYGVQSESPALETLDISRPPDFGFIGTLELVTGPGTRGGQVT